MNENNIFLKYQDIDRHNRKTITAKDHNPSARVELFSGESFEKYQEIMLLKYPNRKKKKILIYIVICIAIIIIIKCKTR